MEAVEGVDDRDELADTGVSTRLDWAIVNPNDGRVGLVLLGMVVEGAAPGYIPDICGSCLRGRTPLGAVAGKGRASLRPGLGFVGKAIAEVDLEKKKCVECRDFAVADLVLKQSKRKASPSQ